MFHQPLVARGVGAWVRLSLRFAASAANLDWVFRNELQDNSARQDECGRIISQVSCHAT